MPEASSVTTTGERKFAVALFADLSGYTALCQRLDPEEVELTVAPQMAALRSTVESSGGTIVHVAGDGFFALFGVPRAQADAAERAASACLAMLDLVAARNAQPGMTAIPDIHIGVASGEVLVTRSEDALGWNVIGSTVNLASRLCDAATAGEALFDESSHGLLGGGVRWRRSRVLDVKGHDVAVTAWELDATAPAALSDSPLVSFVGRRDARRALDSALTAVVRDQQSRVAGVSGEAGIGKTRLLREWLTTTTCRQVWIASSEVTGTPLLELVRTLGVSTSSEAWSSTLGQLASDSASALRDDPLPMLIATARHLATQLAEGSPAVVVIDDLRTSDGSLVAFLEQLVEDPVPVPLLVLCAFRNDTDAPLPADIQLGPLDDASSAELLADCLGASPEPDVARRLLERMQGHPLLTIQTAAYLRESGIVQVEQSRLRLRDARAVDALPTAVRMFIAARIDRLPASEKTALQQLSCLGNEWSTEWALIVLGATAATPIARLSARAFVEIDPSGKHRFAHRLVQQVAYESMTRRDRGSIHRRQLDLLDEHADPSLRAYHAVAWHDATPTTDSERSRASGEAAMRESLAYATELFRSEAQAAHQAIGRATSLVDQYGQCSPQLAIQLLTLDAHCLTELGHFEEALRAATQAHSLATDAVVPDTVRVRALLARGYALSRLRRFQGARQVLDEAAALADATGDGPAKGHALRIMADTWRHSVFTTYVALTEESYRAFEACGDVTGAAECSRILAYLFSTSVPHQYERWAGIARRTTPAHDVRGRAWLARSAMIALGNLYDFRAADQAALEAIDLASRCGARDVTYDALGSHTMYLCSLGRPAVAADAARELLAIVDRHNNPRMQTVAAAWVAPAFVRAGEVQLGLEALMSARVRLGEFGAAEASDVAQAAGAINRDRGEWDEALQAFEDTARAASAATDVLYNLGARLEEARVRLAVTGFLDIPEMTKARDECTEIGAPLVASYVAALCDAARVSARDRAPLTSPAVGACLEERAIRADTRALRHELLCEDAAAPWAEARALWQQLGCTVWLARAQARSGDLEGANHTLDLLDSPAEARVWALGG